MRIYGYQQIYGDTANQVRVVAPGWKDIPLEKVMEKGIGSLAAWSEPHVEQYFFEKSKPASEDYDNDDDEEEEEAPRHPLFSQIRIMVNGESKSFPGMLVTYGSMAGLYGFLKQSWEPTEEPFQQELRELIHQVRPSGAVLKMLKGYFKMNRKDVERIIKKAHGGFIAHKAFRRDMELVRVNDERWYFDDSPDSSQIAFSQMRQRVKGISIPTGAMFWRAEGLGAGKGLFAGFWQGKCRVSDNLAAFAEPFLEIVEKASLYAGSPYIPMEDQCLQAGALLRIPSQNEARRWMKEQLRAREEQIAAPDDGDSLEAAADAARLPDMHLPAGLPSAGFIRDSRGPIHIPGTIPVLTDIADTLSVLSRANHGVFISNRPPQSALRRLPKPGKTLWAVIAVPISPFSEAARVVP